MSQLLANLQSPNLNREVKPDILQVFGDMAQGLGTKFDRYIARVVETLQAAMNIAFSNQTTYHSDAEPDEALIIYNNELRLAIIQSAQGMCHQHACAASCVADSQLGSGDRIAVISPELLQSRVTLQRAHTCSTRDVQRIEHLWRKEVWKPSPGISILDL